MLRSPDHRARSQHWAEGALVHPAPAGREMTDSCIHFYKVPPCWSHTINFPQGLWPDRTRLNPQQAAHLWQLSGCSAIPQKNPVLVQTRSCVSCAPAAEPPSGTFRRSAVLCPGDQRGSGLLGSSESICTKVTFTRSKADNSKAQFSLNSFNNDSRLPVH